MSLFWWWLVFFLPLAFPRTTWKLLAPIPTLSYTIPVKPCQHFWEADKGVCLWQQHGEKHRWCTAAHLAPRELPKAAQRQGWAALMPMFVFTLPKPAALSPLSQEPQIFGLAPAFGSWPERTGSQHKKLSGEAVYHYHWGNYTLSDKNLQGLMWCKILLKGAGMGNSVCFLPPSAPNSNLSCTCFLDLLINLSFFRFYPLLPFSVLAFEVRSKH